MINSLLKNSLSFLKFFFFNSNFISIHFQWTIQNKIKKNFIYNGIKKNKILRNEFNQNSAKFIHQKL